MWYTCTRGEVSMSGNHAEIRKILFRIEKILLIILFCICIKFNPSQPTFWIAMFLISFIMNKFEDSIRREYDDTTTQRLRKLMDEDNER
jgi:uncharacterized membrane protein YtjA (UPF0391 family)